MLFFFIMSVYWWLLAFHSAAPVFTFRSSFMMPLMAINWYIVEATPRSTCSHRPFSRRRWKALKPIIVLLEGRLPPWTLWHTFKESGLNVFRPDSVALALGLPSPHPTHTHTHTHTYAALFLRREGKHVWVALFPGTFPCLSKRELMGLTGDFKGQHKKHEFHRQDISCLSQENFLKDTSSKTKKTTQEFTVSLYATKICLLHNVCPSKQHCWDCVSDLMFANAATIIRLYAEPSHRSGRASKNVSRLSGTCQTEG